MTKNQRAALVIGLVLLVGFLIYFFMYGWWAILILPAVVLLVSVVSFFMNLLFDWADRGK